MKGRRAVQISKQHVIEFYRRILHFMQYVQEQKYLSAGGIIWTTVKTIRHKLVNWGLIVYSAGVRKGTEQSRSFLCGCGAVFINYGDCVDGGTTKAHHQEDTASPARASAWYHCCVPDESNSRYIHVIVTDPEDSRFEGDLFKLELFLSEDCPL
uniref:Uncharacterized protein n=1 Tax=Phlebotomus papatasi TaxID=29031 RepID=A0A1B0DLR7_PHLPP